MPSREAHLHPMAAASPAIAAGSAAPTAGSISSVRIEQGKFVLQATGKPYVPHGFNYVRLDIPGHGGHATFSPFVYDRKQVDAALTHMEANGFNAVRVFINGLRGQRGCMFKDRDATAPDPAYLDNLAEFLLLAKQHGILVIPCFEFFPMAVPYREGLNEQAKNIGPANRAYLETTHIKAKQRYLRDVIGELRTRDPACLSAVFCWDLMNEVCYGLEHAPFSLDKGTVTPANGKTYDLATEKEKLADDMAIYWVDQMADAIRAEIPDALINANVFTYHAVGRAGPGDFHQDPADWKNRYPFRPTALRRSKADVIDIHLYPADEKTLLADMKSVEHAELFAGLKADPSKALIVGEFGVFDAHFPKLSDAAAWMGQLSRCLPELGAAGWIYWTYDCDEQERLWNAMSGKAEILQALGK
jgi:hypothetical protein